MLESDSASRPAKKRRRRAPLEVTGRALAGVVLGTAVVSAGAAWAITVATSGPHTWGLGAWLADFAKSSGLAGVLAVIAALIAFLGLNLQLAHQRRAETNRAWWERFQWASSRALPADPSHDALPYDAIVSTFTALAESAVDEVQEGAVGAVMDVASARAKAPIARAEGLQPKQATPDAAMTTPSNDAYAPAQVTEADPPEQSEKAELALSRYVRSTAGTAADSSAARGRLYEIELIRALERFPEFETYSPQPSAGADLMLESNGRRIIIEVQYLKPGSRPRLPVSTERQLRTHRHLSNSDVALVVANVELRVDPETRADGIETFLWRGSEEDTLALIERLRQLTRSSSAD